MAWTEKEIFSDTADNKEMPKKMERRTMLQKIKAPAKGQSLLEFALILPILLLIVLGVIEFGRIFLLYTEASNAAREAARYGVAAGNSPNNVPRYLDCDEIRNAAVNTTVLSDFEPIEDNIEIAYDYPVSGGTAIYGTCGSVTEEEIIQGYRIVVTVTATFEPILPIIPIPDITFTPSSRRTILKDIIIQNEPELPPPPPGCRLLQTASNPTAGGEVTANPEPNCGATWYVVGTPVVLTAVPDSDYNFLFWSGSVAGEPGVNTSNPVISITMNDNHSAVANFDAIECFQIETLVNPGGDAGSVDIQTAENCPNDTGWLPGTGILMEALPKVGYTFDHWEVTNPDYAAYNGSTLNPLIIQNGDLVSDVTFTAFFTFTPNCYDIITTINPAGEGTVNYNPPRGACPGGWVNGPVTIQAFPDEPAAYQFESWSGDITSVNNPETITISGANVNITANFEQVADVADLFLQKSDSVDPAIVGQPFTYTLIIGNNGPDAAGDARVQDSLPPSVTPVSATPTQGSCNIGGGVVNCTIGFMPAFTNQSVNIAVVPNAVGTIQNTAFVFNNDAGQIDTNPTNNFDSETTTIAPSADLAVTKSGPATANVGDTLTYNIVVSNNGPSAAASVVLVDALPLAVTYLNSTSSAGACGQSGTQVICNFGNIPSNGTPINVTIQAIATTQSNALNQATVSSSTNDPNTVNNTATVSTLIGSNPGNLFITLTPTCGTTGANIQVRGYNWPTNGTEDTTIYWGIVGGPVLGTVTDQTVELGGGLWVKNVTVPIGATAGLNTIVAHRPQGSGQQASAPITVPCPAPDLVISSNVTLLSPAPINQGDPVSFRVTVTNTGVTAAVSQFPVSIYFNPIPVPAGSTTHISGTFKSASAVINGLAVNASYVLTLTAQAGFPISGTNTVYAVADSDPSPDGQINETNETNNVSGGLAVNVQPCVSNCGGGGQTGNGILAGQAFVPSVSGELLPQPNVYVVLAGPGITDTQFTFTDGNGTYVFTGLATGSYTVSGCITVDGATYFFAVAVNIVSGLVTEQDLLLSQGPCT